MRRRSVVGAILGFVVLAFLIPPRAEGGSGTEPHQHFERMQAARRAQAHPVDFFAPYFSIEGLRETRLFLLNTIADPIVVDVVARSEDQELPLGAYTIEAQRHIEISLRERLIGFEDAFGTGCLLSKDQGVQSL